MKTNRILLAGMFALSLWSCKKKSEDVASSSTPAAVYTAGTVIGNDTMLKAGSYQGVFKQNTNYYIKGDIFVNPGETITAEPGAKVTVMGNYTITVRGTLNSLGTIANPVKFTIPDAFKSQSNNNVPAGEGGFWGGLNLDSATVVLKGTVVEYMGGPDKTGSPRLGISCKHSLSVDIEDSWIRYCYDDGIRIHATQNCIVKRNTFEHCGGTNNGGEALNIKQGATGDVSYNIFWNSATKSVKLETDVTVQYPQTQWNVYNNTFINTGFRNNAKPGPGTSVDLYSQANIYNNLYINCLRGITIFNFADAKNVNYDYNLFNSTDANVDSAGQAGSAYFTLPLAKYYYDTTDSKVWGNAVDGLGPLKVRSHDIRVPVTSAASQTIITKLRNFTDDYGQLDWLPTGGTVPYNAVLASNSPAIGKGTTTTNWQTFSKLAIAPTPGSDIGAKQTSSNLGNKH